MSKGIASNPLLDAVAPELLADLLPVALVLALAVAVYWWYQKKGAAIVSSIGSIPGQIETGTLNLAEQVGADFYAGLDYLTGKTPANPADAVVISGTAIVPGA